MSNGPGVRRTTFRRSACSLEKLEGKVWDGRKTAVNLERQALEATARRQISSCVFWGFIEDFILGTDNVSGEGEMG